MRLRESNDIHLVIFFYSGSLRKRYLMTAVPFIDSTVLKTGCSVGFRCSVLSFMLVLNLGLSSKEKCPYFAGDSRIFLPPSIQGGPKNGATDSCP